MKGRPFTLRCSKCKRHEDYRDPNRPSHQNLMRTGRERVKRRYGYRYNVRQVEVRHTTCGHVFWTDHLNASALPLAGRLAAGAE